MPWGSPQLREWRELTMDRMSCQPVVRSQLYTSASVGPGTWRAWGHRSTFSRSTEWEPALADAFSALLDAIVRNLVIVDAQKDVDLNSAPDVDGGAIEARKSEIVASAEARAADLEVAFRDGLVLAYEAQNMGHPEISLDDRQAEQNAIADALITYLVSFDLGESRSEETDPGHYLYFISVTWGDLYQFAEANGIDLPAALANAATIPGG